MRAAHEIKFLISSKRVLTKVFCYWKEAMMAFKGASRQRMSPGSHGLSKTRYQGSAELRAQGGKCEKLENASHGLSEYSTVRFTIMLR